MQTHAQTDTNQVAAGIRQPTIYETVRRMPVVELLASAGLDHQSNLKIASWHGSHDNDAKAQCDDYHLVSQHLNGAPVHRMDRRAPSNRSRTFALMPSYASSKWTSDHNVCYRHFYLDSAFVRSVYQDMSDQDLTDDTFIEIDMCPDVGANALLDRCAEECLNDADINRLKLDGWAVLLAEKLLRIQSAHLDQKAETAAPHKLDAVAQADIVDFIETNLEEEISLGQLADVANMSMYQLSRAFKAFAGKSPYRYVLERRIARARALLSVGKDPIADIAYQCGFSSQQHMTNTFSRMLGVTPARYRKDMV